MKTFFKQISWVGRNLVKNYLCFFIPDSVSGSFGSVFLLLPWSMVGIFTGK